MLSFVFTFQMPFDAESEDELFDLIVYDYPQKPDKKTMSELSIDATEFFLHVSVKYMKGYIPLIFYMYENYLLSVDNNRGKT